MDTPTHNLRISLVQGETLWHDPAGNREYYGDLIAPLHDTTDLILLPETFTSGFSNDAIDQAETMDGPTVKLLYNLFDWVSPELYIKEGDPITMQVFLRRYRAQVDLSRTLVGLAIHKDYRITETGWLPHLAAQIRRVTALGCAGVAMWAPVHLRDSGERKAVDALLSGAVDK